MKYSCLNGWTNYITVQELIEKGQFPRSNILELAMLFDKRVSYNQIYNYFEDKRDDFLPIVIFNGYHKNNYDLLKEEIIEYYSSEDSEEGDFFNIIVMAIFCAKEKYAEKWEKYLNYNTNQGISFEEKLKLFKDVINYILDILDIPSIEVCEYHFLESEAKSSYYDRILYNQDNRKVYLQKNDFHGYYQDTMFYWVFQVISKIILFEIEESEDFNEYLNIGTRDIRELKNDPEKLSKVYNGIANVLSKYYQIYARSDN